MGKTKKVKAWIEAMRLRTLPVSVAGVIAGTACAMAVGGFNWLPALICLVFAVLAQIASNFGNEYYDFKKGLDKKGREGFRRGVTEGDLSPEAMRNATFGTLGLACLVGLSLIYWGGWWLIAVGVLVALFAVAYSAGPYPLSHHGLGDIAVVIFFGIVPVTLTAWLQVLDMAVLRIAFPISVSVGLLAAMVLMVNNYRDREDDAMVGKNTTAVIFGPRVMRYCYIFSGLAGVGIALAAIYPYVNTWLYAVGYIFVALYAGMFAMLSRRTGKALNPVLGITAMLLLLFSIYLLVALGCR
ncbi:MAG: 1,4-dihydroxy-2-naphthoate octaprenyltransferase [Muribaculaceae bacterium]|nr:1,4-dihydroxy-2-naphthoate octaprenyltransferase [Muribaculaceae bacterium]